MLQYKSPYLATRIKVMKKGILLALALSLTFVIGCKEDETPIIDDNPPAEKTRFELVTEGAWKVSDGTIVPEIEVDILGNTITVNTYWDLLKQLGGGEVKECDKDNLMYLNADSTVLQDEGPTKCDPNDPQSEDGGKWNFMENETKLNFSSFPFDPTQSPQVLDIDSLTATDMHLSMIYPFKDPITGKETNHTIKLKFVNTK
jgi:hypothetical protein